MRVILTECLSNQHTAWHCNRTILRVDLTRIREDSKCMRAGSTRIRASVFIFI
jgi:hypothetical protein